MKRQNYVLGNWKMHKTARESAEYLSVLISMLANVNSPSIVGIAPPFTSLSACDDVISRSQMDIWLGAQNLHKEEAGAFTGEISISMLQEYHVRFVLVGHSERRHLFHEEEAEIAYKVERAALSGILPVLCIGETEEEREQGITKSVLSQQMIQGLSRLSPSMPFVLAYEPVWAIGSGKVPSPEEVQEIQAFCRKEIEKTFSLDKANSVAILYGGSVKPENARSFAACPDVDGLLVGGGSLEPTTFMNIIQQFCL